MSPFKLTPFLYELGDCARSNWCTRSSSGNWNGQFIAAFMWAFQPFYEPTAPCTVQYSGGVVATINKVGQIRKAFMFFKCIRRSPIGRHRSPSPNMILSRKIQRHARTGS